MNYSKRSIDNLKGVHPSLVTVMMEAIKKSPCDFTITEGVRTAERQKSLYAQGRTAKGGIVTYADGVKNKSNHQVKADGFGYAVDIYPYFDGKVQVSVKDVIPRLKQITDHIKSVAMKLGVKLDFGIDWKKPFDPPHIQIKQ